MRYDTTLSGFSLLCNCQTRDIRTIICFCQSDSYKKKDRLNDPIESIEAIRVRVYSEKEGNGTSFSAG